jgi:cell division protein FtsB
MKESTNPTEKRQVPPVRGNEYVPSFIGQYLLFLLLLLSVIFGEASAQDKSRMTRKEKEAAWRAERLRKRAAEERKEIHNDSVQYMQALSALKGGSWALEASNVTFNNGASNFVTESTNFVSVNNGTATVQTALDNSNIYSPNGLGGVTLTGRIANEEMTVDRYGNIHYNFGIYGSEISATVNVILSAGSNQATATVNPNYNNSSMTMSGYIYPYGNAGIIEGTSGYY